MSMVGDEDGGSGGDVIYPHDVNNILFILYHWTVVGVDGTVHHSQEKQVY